MNRWYQVGGITLLASLLVFSQVAAYSVERTVISGEDGMYRVILDMPGGTVAGISESIPAGYRFAEVLLPPGQYRIDGDTLYIAVMGERNVTYLVEGKENPERAIRGVWRDIVTGENGTVHAAGETGSIPGSAPEKRDSTDAGKTGPAPIVTCIGAAVALLAAGKIACRRQCSP
jgi:hypothetical protein